MLNYRPRTSKRITIEEVALPGGLLADISFDRLTEWDSPCPPSFYGPDCGYDDTIELLSALIIEDDSTRRTTSTGEWALCHQAAQAWTDLHPPDFPVREDSD